MKNDSRINLKHQMESIYQELPPDRIPWNLEDPPELLVDLIESKQILPCEAVDLGFSGERLADDPDFASLREDPNFRSLVARMN